MDIKILKLFEKTDEGALPNAIVNYTKQEWTIEIQDFHECVASYKYYLEINLWIILLRFTWIKKLT